MITVRVKNGIVVEVIPNYALPVEKWYGPEFALQCMEAPDEVGQGWIYDGESFSEPSNDVDIETVRTQKEKEISDACNAAIVAGMDVETTKGTEHFSLQETDQINLTTAYNAVLSGAEGYPYHADGTLCRLFTAKEITDVSNASIQHKLYHTTLCNHLLTWIRRAETEDELNGITYSADGLPEDLAQNMQQVLTAATSLTA